MKHVLPTLLVLTCAASTARAQTRPNFSGTWTMDASRSESAHQSDPIGPVTLVITQTDRELTIDTTTSSATGHAVYLLTGAESKIPGGTATAHWDGTRLVVDAVRDVRGTTVTTKETRSLNASGDEMLVDTVLVVQHGYSQKGAQNYGTGKDVYVRRR